MKCHINLSVFLVFGLVFFLRLFHIFWGVFLGGVLRPPPRSALCIVKNNEYIIDFMRIDMYIEHISNFGGVF